MQGVAKAPRDTITLRQQFDDMVLNEEIGAPHELAKAISTALATDSPFSAAILDAPLAVPLLPSLLNRLKELASPYRQ